MNASDVVNYVKKTRNEGVSYQTMADVLQISKPAVQRIYETGRVGREVAKKMGLDPSAKVLRDRVRRAARKAELERLRADNERMMCALTSYAKLQTRTPVASGIIDGEFTFTDYGGLARETIKLCNRNESER